MGSTRKESMRDMLQAGKSYAITIKPTIIGRMYSRIDFAELRNTIRRRGIDFEEGVNSFAYESDSRGLVHFHGVVKVGRGRQTVRTISIVVRRGWHIHISGECDANWYTYISKHAACDQECVWQREHIRFINLRERFTEIGN